MANKKKTNLENHNGVNGAVRQSGFATVPQACEFLSLSRASLYKLMDQDELAYAKFGGARRIPWAALQEYGERCTISSH